MSRSIDLYAGGRKGLAPRRLKEQVDKTVAAARQEDAPENLLRVLEGIRQAVNKLIPIAARGAVIEIRASVLEDPVGGWGASVMIDVREPATEGEDNG